MKRRLISSAILAIALLPQAWAKTVEFSGDGRSLKDIAKDVSQRSGTEIVISDSLGADAIHSAINEEGWSAAIQALLSGYNYEAQWANNGLLQRVIVTGRNGNGQDPTIPSLLSADMEMLNYQGESLAAPDHLSHLNAGSVVPVNIPVDALLGMKLGDRIGLTLPSGHYDVIHDNRFDHENGDKTWVGYLDSEGQGYRVLLTTGLQGTLGQIVTPDGVYNFELHDGQTWMIDLNASGLQASSLEGDDSDPHLASGDVMMAAKAKRQTTAAAAAKATTTTAKAATTTTSGTNTPVVDLMVLYTSGVKGAPTIATRVNNLVAKANQAYLDSKISLKLRVVYSAPVSYTQTNSNDTALSDITNGRSVFSNVAALRTQYGADLVTLIRPFNYKTQLSCGVAWVNGSGGSTMSARYGYSVVSDGVDPGGSYYCTDFTLAHELGHNMGSTHDAAHSNTQGRYSYSYGYGFANKFGTIMSYYNPTIGYFSSPSLTYNKQVLGSANANNALSINQTAASVAGFLPTVK